MTDNEDKRIYCPQLNSKCILYSCAAFTEKETRDIIHSKSLKDGKHLVTFSPDYKCFYCEYYKKTIGLDSSDPNVNLKLNDWKDKKETNS